ncbi:hypothetical protein A4A49_46198 [Nicotiana attenuata]|uniref:Uncharacterized protein n=1 Tax=Nicotiana attenuata TaxID=49451 RepID=A0A314KMZ4_NICAT|nr:hypothetical protein A4A49_46198 [Nicotiana attenuata]
MSQEKNNVMCIVEASFSFLDIPSLVTVYFLQQCRSGVVDVESLASNNQNYFEMGKLRLLLYRNVTTILDFGKELLIFVGVPEKGISTLDPGMNLMLYICTKWGHCRA